MPSNNAGHFACSKRDYECLPRACTINREPEPVALLARCETNDLLRKIQPPLRAEFPQRLGKGSGGGVLDGVVTVALADVCKPRVEGDAVAAGVGLHVGEVKGEQLIALVVIVRAAVVVHLVPVLVPGGEQTKNADTTYQQRGCNLPPTPNRQLFRTNVAVFSIAC